MEILLSILPAIFCFWTGILIAWGGFTAYQTINVLHNIHKMKRRLRISDMLQTLTVVLGTIILTILLFIIPDFATFHMNTILFLEVWYSIALLQVTEHSIKSIKSISAVNSPLSKTMSVVFHHKAA